MLVVWGATFTSLGSFCQQAALSVSLLLSLPLLGVCHTALPARLFALPLQGQLQSQCFPALPSQPQLFPGDCQSWAPHGARFRFQLRLISRQKVGSRWGQNSWGFSSCWWRLLVSEVPSLETVRHVESNGQDLFQNPVWVRHGEGCVTKEAGLTEKAFCCTHTCKHVHNLMHSLSQDKSHATYKHPHQ